MALDMSSAVSATGVFSQWRSRVRSNSSSAAPQSGDWVTLREPVGPFAHTEALLLCQQAGDWVVWIPEHGEATVSPRQFA